MKVLFAVNDENISESIVRKYQQQYKEIISYKNVYFFNAILRELQRNKNYDRIVISEDLEEFSSSSFEQKDKFIFDTLDNISDEAVSQNGNDIPIILICTERRTKSEDILYKLFGIGLYNAIIGDDRSTDQVCSLINKPRLKKEAKLYYNIDSENVSYEREKDSDVSESEMNSILNHFRRLGKNESKYLDSFNNIVSQYNNAQLKVIIAVLPENVKNYLQDNSPEYQKLMCIDRSNKNSVEEKKEKSRNLRVKNRVKTKKDISGISEKTLDDAKNVMTKNVVIPSAMKTKINKKSQEDIDEDIVNTIEPISEEKNKKRGRPRKKQEIEEEPISDLKPKKRGRPKKVQTIEQNTEDEAELQSILPGFEEEEDLEENNIQYKQETLLPGFEDYDEDDYDEDHDDEDDDTETLFSSSNKNNKYILNDDSPEKEFPDLDLSVPKDENLKNFRSLNSEDNNNYLENEEDEDTLDNSQNMVEYDNVFDDESFESLLSGDKKVTAFVGTSKNGTSFIVNNIAQILSNMGINTAILDATQNKSAYYIYTNDDENLRATAIKSINGLINGAANGIKINNNLTVYTGLPVNYNEINNSHPILETLIKNHSIVLIDCDFETPIEYFDKSQEIYLVQSMDVLTIQPLTEFLRRLKVKNVLDERKIRIILNKYLRLKGVSGKNIVGGMSNYNDPEMSFMTELFNKNLVKIVAEIPFDEDVYVKYLESMIECEIKLNKYPKEIKQILTNLAFIVYPLLNGNDSKKGNKKSKLNDYSSSFSEGMNNTLNNMRKKY